MRDGLYKVVFSNGPAAGYGVIYVSDGKFRGGDSTMVYTGSLRPSGDRVVAELKTFRHAPVGESVFGRDDVTVNLTGTWIGDQASFAADVGSFKASLSRIAD